MSKRKGASQGKDEPIEAESHGRWLAVIPTKEVLPALIPNRKSRRERFISFLRKVWPAFFCLILGSAEVWCLWIVFGPFWMRWWSSIRYFAFSFMQIFGWQAPAAPNAGTADYSGAKSFFESIEFQFNAACGLMANGHFFDEWKAGFFKALATLLQISGWVVEAVVIYEAAKSALKDSPRKGRQNEKTKALLAFERISPKVKGFFSNRRKEVSAYVAKGSKGALWILAFGFMPFVMSPLGPMAMDVGSGYFVFLVSAFTGGAGDLLLSILVDLATTVKKLGWLNLAWGCWVAFLILRHSALKTLREMQDSNYDRATRRCVGAIASGQPGSGHSAMSTSEAMDWEYSLRDQLMGDIHKARTAFPDFPWSSLEWWVAKHAEKGSFADEVDENGKVTGKKEIGDLVDRAQFEIAIRALYGEWEKDGFAAEKGGVRHFFGYDGRKLPREWFDGAKQLGLLEAVTNYACAYFLTYKGIVMITANYSIQDRMQAAISTFTLYGKHSDYLKHGCRPPAPALGFCAGTEWDELRLGKKLNPTAELMAHYDGGAIVMDEISLERGNRVEHYAKGDKSGKASPENDHLNDWMKLFRHFYTNAGRPIGKIFANTQREGAVNGDMTSLFEESDWISSNDGEDNALPFWAADDFVCSRAVGVVDSWIDLWKNRERRQTLPNRILQILVQPVANHWYRMRLSYGFERLHVSCWTGQPEGGGAGESDLFEYYLIYRKMRADAYKTDTFHALVRMRSMGVREGYQQAHHYESLDLTPEDYRRSASYINEGIVENIGAAKEEAAEKKAKIEADAARIGCK